MRDRLVATFVGLTLAVLALFAVPAAYLLADAVQDQQQQRTDRTASLAAAAVGARLAAGVTVDDAYLAALRAPGERLEYVTSDGRRLSAGSSPAASLSSTSPVPGGGTVTVSRSRSTVADQVADDVLPLAALGLLLAAASGVLGVLVARRFARPFGDLSEVAADIGAGRFDTPVPRYGVREADQLGRTLRDTARRLDTLVARERSLSVAASHELRTPITALRLSLEDLTLWKQVPPEVVDELRQAIAQVDRLGDAVTELLEVRRDDVAEEQVAVDLVELATTAVEPWRSRLVEQDRRLVLKTSAPVPAWTSPEVVTRVVDALLAHAADRGAGTVTVDVSALRTVLRVRVSDQGDRRLPSGVLHGDGTSEAEGLADAAMLAESIGGYLTVQDAPQTRLLLVLPHRTNRS